MKKEKFVQLYSVVGNHPNLMGLPFNISDHSDTLIEYLHNYISDRSANQSQESITVMEKLKHRGLSLTANYENVFKIHAINDKRVKIEHMLTRVIEDPMAGNYQLLMSVIHARLDDGLMAYRAPPLRLFMRKDNKSWVKIEPLVEPLVGEEKNLELFKIANLNVVVSKLPPPTKSYRLNTTNAQSSV